MIFLPSCGKRILLETFPRRSAKPVHRLGIVCLYLFHDRLPARHSATLSFWGKIRNDQLSVFETLVMDLQ